MLYTINRILNENNVKQEDSVYRDDPDAVKTFEISAGNFFEISNDQEALDILGDSPADGNPADGNPADDSPADGNPLDGSPVGGGPRAAADKIPGAQVLARLDEIRIRLKFLKNDGEDLTHAHADEIKALRLEKKHLMGLTGHSRTQAPKAMILFKNCLYAASFKTIKSYIPKLSGVDFRSVDEMPLFIKNLKRLKAAVKTGTPLAVSGGPCLFGVGEMLVNVALWDGSLLTYDFSSGRHFMSNGDARDLTLDLMEYDGDVKGIDFVNRKRGVTSQEYDSIHCLFEVARALDAKLAIPLPDMSYIKFFTNIVAPVDKKVAMDAIERFSAEAYKISDMYLEVIRLLKLEYPEVEVAVVHGRDAQMCQTFYRQREPFLTPTVIRRLTAVRGKTDAVLDYITMPALPYYLWGIKDIIQMDSLDETDSYRKCCRIHKGHLNLYAMMYPERLSGDGENTIFYAPLKYKEYLTGTDGRLYFEKMG